MLEQLPKKSGRPIILCFVSFYLPSYRAGGPVRTISHFVDHFGDQFDIRIITRDRDLGDSNPYSGVQLDAWNLVGKSQVFYASERMITLRGVVRLLRITPHDLLYLNSFFSYSFTILPLIARRFTIKPYLPCVIAPRGELSTGATALKAHKKRLYLTLVKAVGLYRGLQWQASSEFEVQDIRRELGDLAKIIHIAADLPPKVNVNEQVMNTCQIRARGPLRVVFLSRISPMKNLDFLLKVLIEVTQPIEFAIYGPIQDKEYWSICESLIGSLPENVKAKYLGDVTPDKVHDVFAAYDLFALPSRGENYGHVILESLRAGTPVLISDQTQWQADDAGGISTLAISEQSSWSMEINRWAKFDDSLLLTRRKAAKNIVNKIILLDKILDQNKSLFDKSLSQ